MVSREGPLPGLAVSSTPLLLLTWLNGVLVGDRANGQPQLSAYCALGPRLGSFHESLVVPAHNPQMARPYPPPSTRGTQAEM